MANEVLFEVAAVRAEARRPLHADEYTMAGFQSRVKLLGLKPEQYATSNALVNFLKRRAEVLEGKWPIQYGFTDGHECDCEFCERQDEGAQCVFICAVSGLRVETTEMAGEYYVEVDGHNIRQAEEGEVEQARERSNAMQAEYEFRKVARGEVHLFLVPSTEAA